MNYKFKYTDKIVGVFVLLSFVLLIGSLFLIAFNQKLFKKKYTFYTRFNDAIGLSRNEDIMFKGFKIGKVKDITLNKENLVDVEFYIFENFIDRITENSVINKASNPITGSTIVFTPNKKTNRIADEYSFIPSLNSEMGQYLLALNQVEKKADSISNIITNIEVFLTSLNSDHNAGDNSIARILVNAADIVESIKYELKTIDKILSNVNQLSHNMKNPDGLVQRMIDPEGDYMFNSLKTSLNSLVIIMEDLSKFSNFINTQSSQIETLLLEGKETMVEAQDVIEGIKNNPLIKYGIQEKKEQDVVTESIRDRDF